MRIFINFKTRARSKHERRGRQVDHDTGDAGLVCDRGLAPSGMTAGKQKSAKVSLDTDTSNNSWQPSALLAAVAVLVMTLLQALPSAWQDWLRYDRAGIADGQWWRIVTGHYIHLGWSHLGLNAAGLAVGTWLFGPERSTGQWLIATTISTLACGLGLWWFSPSVQWCVGLSGVLHGLMLVGSLTWALRSEPAGWWLTGFWIAKLVWEAFRGEMPWSGALTGGTVVTQAHLWGACGGVLYVGLSLAWSRRRL